MKRIIKSVVGALLIAHTLSAQQQSKDTPPPQYISASGSTVTFQNAPGSGTITLEYLFTTGISAPTITVQGCGSGGTCTTLTAITGTNPYTTATNAMATFAGGYFQYKVTATYTGTGTITVAFVGIQAKAGSSSGGGATLTPNAIQYATSTTATRAATGTDVAALLGSVKFASQSGCATAVASVQPGVSAVGYADSAACLQSIINTAGVKTLILDAGYGLSTTLLIPSGKKLYCPNQTAGVIMLPNSNASVLENTTQVTNVAAVTANVLVGGSTTEYVVSNQADSYISVEGCMLNANSTEALTAADHRTFGSFYITALQFLGVDHLSFKNIKVYDQPAFALAFSNTSNVEIDGYESSIPAAYMAVNVIKNTDGIHMNGPVSGVRITNSTIGPVGDDAIAINGDDWYSPTSTDPNGSFTHYPGWQQGPIADLVTDNIQFINVKSGVRLLSSGAVLDDIHLNHFYGTTGGQLATISPFTNTGGCVVGSVSFHDWNVQRGNRVDQVNLSSFYNDCQSIASEEFDHVRIPPLVTPASGNMDVFTWTGRSTVGQLTLNENVLSNLTGAQLPAAAPWYRFGGATTQMHASINWQTRSGDTSVLLGGSGPSQLFASIAGDSTRFEGWTPGFQPTSESINSPSRSYMYGRFTGGLLPQSIWINSGSSTDAGRWDCIPLGATSVASTFNCRAINDANTVGNSWLTVTRSGASVSSILLGATTSAPQFGTTGSAPNFSTSGAVVASATTIAITSPIFHISGTSAIATMTFPTGFDATHGGCVDVIADGAWQTTTAGNFFAVMTAVPGTPYRFCATNTSDKWFGK